MANQQQAIFTISLDCDLADRISDHHIRYFTNENRRRAYGDLVALFEKWDVSATFAFVTVFILAKEEVGSYADLLEAASCRSWLLTSEETPRRKDSRLVRRPAAASPSRPGSSFTVGVE
jgi:hypothetical protein